MSEEAERLEINREYFEAGCLCILSGAVKVLDPTVSDKQAVAHYEKECCCSRNYIDVE